MVVLYPGLTFLLIFYYFLIIADQISQRFVKSIASHINKWVIRNKFHVFRHQFRHTTKTHRQRFHRIHTITPPATIMNLINEYIARLFNALHLVKWFIFQQNKFNFLFFCKLLAYRNNCIAPFIMPICRAMTNADRVIQCNGG